MEMVEVVTAVGEKEEEVMGMEVEETAVGEKEEEGMGTGVEETAEEVKVVAAGVATAG